MKNKIWIGKFRFFKNPESRYIKIEEYLLNPVSRDFWHQIVTLFSSYKC